MPCCPENLLQQCRGPRDCQAAVGASPWMCRGTGSTAGNTACAIPSWSTAHPQLQGRFLSHDTQPSTTTQTHQLCSFIAYLLLNSKSLKAEAVGGIGLSGTRCLKMNPCAWKEGILLLLPCIEHRELFLCQHAISCCPKGRVRPFMQPLLFTGHGNQAFFFCSARHWLQPGGLAFCFPPGPPCAPPAFTEASMG